MGAELYYHTTPYAADPTEALERLQQELLAGFDFQTAVAEKVANMQEAVDATAVDDEYDLHDYYKEELERAKSIASEPIPADFQGQLHLMRRLHEDSGEGIGNLLDVNGIAGTDGADWTSARPLSPKDLKKEFGAEKLLAADADAHAGQANNWLGRGECICFPLYAHADDPEPSHWCFVGNTVD